MGSLSMSSSTFRSISAPTEHVVAFGQQRPGALFVPLRPLGDGPALETWESNDDVMFGSATADATLPLAEAARERYELVIAEVREAGFPYFVRMWNYVGGINEAEDDVERYKLFCAGRHDAFIEAGYHHDVDLPAASAVGMRGRGLIAYFLAAREPGMQVENPRQVAAYNYPPQYGVKSPSFSRATVWKDTVFISGTSSVVGHASVHQGDVLAQLDETLRNIDLVLAQTGRTLADITSAKTYVRHASDYAAIAQRLEPLFTNNVYVEADICRADLLLEIEAVAR
jgi:chorismate lyase/3-hydroxybenzoate synthase